MNYSDFENLIKEIMEPYDQNARNTASNVYFALLEESQESYIENMLTLFEQEEDPQLIHFSAIILRKEITLKCNKSSLFSIPEELEEELLTSILERLAESSPDIARALGDLAGEISAALIPNIELTLTFIEEAFEQNETMQNEAAHIVAVISNVNINKISQLGMQVILAYIQKALESNYYEANVYGITAIETILINMQFSNTPDASLTYDVQKQLFNAVLIKMQEMSNDISNSRRFFLKSLELLSELLDLCVDLMNDFLPVLLELIQNLLHSGIQNEDLFKMGANFLASMCDTGDFGYIDFEPEQYAMMQHFVIDYLLEVFLQMQEYEIEDYLEAQDPEDMYDRNSLKEVVYDCLERIFGGKFSEIGMPAFEMFAQEKQSEWEFMYTLLKIIDVLVTCQNFNTSAALPELIEIMFKETTSEHIMIQYQAEICIKHVIDENQNNYHLMEQISKRCLGGLPALFESEYPMINIGAMNILLALLDVLKQQSITKLKDFCFEVFQSFIQHQNLSLQAGAVEILIELFKKVDPNEIIEELSAQLSLIIEQFITCIPELGVEMTKYEIRLFSAITSATGTIITKFPEFESQASSIVPLFIQLIKSPIADQIHEFMDILIEALAEVVSVYSQLINEQDLNSIIAIFINIIQTPLFNEGKEQYLSDSGPAFNAHIRQEEQNVYLAIASLIKYIPERMVGFLDVILQSFASKNYYESYSFTDIAQICFLVPRVLHCKGVGIKEVYDYIENLVKVSILPENINRCSEEVRKITSAILDLAKEVLLWNDPQGSIFTEIVIEAIVSLLSKGLSSFKNWVDELEYDDLSTEEKLEYTCDEMKYITLSSDNIEQIINIFLTFENKAQTVEALFELTDQIEESEEIAAVFLLPLYDEAQLRQQIVQSYLEPLIQRMSGSKYHDPLDCRLASLFLLDGTDVNAFEEVFELHYELFEKCYSGDTGVLLLLILIITRNVQLAEQLLEQLVIHKCESLLYIRVLIMGVENRISDTIVNQSLQQIELVRPSLLQVAPEIDERINALRE